MTAGGYVRTADDLRDLAEELNKPLVEVERDCLLVRIAARLQADFPDQLCFKGGFVLRHVYGSERLSVDIDATRHDPPRHKLDSGDVAQSIRAAGQPFYKIPAIQPDTDTGQSLDFDPIKYRGPLSTGQVAVEVSYREDICLNPVPARIGPPYIEPIVIPTMDPVEMLAEKYRTLCQRRRETDLLDAALLWDGVAGEIDPRGVAALIPVKFADGIVRGGNHANRVRSNVESMSTTYGSVIPGRAPGAMDYDRAAHLVLTKVSAVFGR